MRDTTLCFPVDEMGRILLGRKKRGFGAAKWNGFGGKLEDGETYRRCALRELREEAGLCGCEADLELAAFLWFRFSADPSLDHVGCVYFLHRYTGDVVETEEMEPQWFSAENLPFDHMWQGDKIWLPRLLQGEKLRGTIVFAADNDTVQSIDLQLAESLRD